MKHGILVCTLAAGLAWAQSPQVIQNTRTMMDTVQKNATAASNEALGISQPSKPASSQPAVKPAAAPAKANLVPAKTKVAPAKAAAPAPQKPAVQKAAAAPVPKLSVKPVAQKTAKPAAEKLAPKKAEPAPKSTPAAVTSAPSPAPEAAAAEEAKSDDSETDKQDKKWSMSGKRDPFISPVVNRTGGSGCSTGKKCLEIGAINLRGVVHSDAGYIAVVTNSLNKAYFLRENDPVFDGYVVKITGDSIIFKETLQDRLGKTFTREVTKKITTPSV